MNIFINTKNGVPIYEQIYIQIKMNIINGTFNENEALPSIRNLAKDLQISVITTKKAYEKLEHNGLIYTVTGKGCFVSQQKGETLKEENLEKIKKNLRSVVSLAKANKLDKNTFIEILNYLWEE